ncbi:MAG: hypothetical protein OZ914_07585 [Anaerolineaceae bacterium]|jgi:succinate dehydrogenase hydrophobic anchor subunit|nr:hypothetical protein [Anaerolineaceae bacterium]OQY90268.1 MAG: hypothetical protein B6D38_04590 [Anaerolineae bacterium UTCFX1]
MRESRWWSLHLLVVPLILILLGAHFAIMHYAPIFYAISVEEAREFAAMIERGKSVGQFVIYILLLAAGLYHGLYGTRGILRELPLPATLAKLVDVGMIIFGIVIFALGVYVTWWTFSFELGG